MDDETKAFFKKFADIAENFQKGGQACEFEGHFDKAGPLYLVHDQEGVKWKEWFVCPTCNDELYLLVCNSVHKMLTQWADEGTEQLDFFNCTECKTDWEFLDVYNGGFPWG